MQVLANTNLTIPRFTTGCIRKCDFCLVHGIEGELRPANPMNLNPRGKYIYLLDGNFFASPAWKESIRTLQNYKQPVQFEGIDIRILTDEMLKELYKIKLKGRAHIAWDNPKERIDRQITHKIPENKRYKFMCYVLIGWNTTHEENIYRVRKLTEIGIDPFVMPYDRSDTYQKRFARWVNHKAIYKKCKWEEYQG